MGQNPALAAFSQGRSGPPMSEESGVGAAPLASRQPNIDAAPGGGRLPMDLPEISTEGLIEKPTEHALIAMGVDPKWAGYAGTATGILSGFVPFAGTGLAVADTKAAWDKGDYLGAGLSGLGAIPVFGGLAKLAGRGARALRSPAGHEVVAKLAHEGGYRANCESSRGRGFKHRTCREECRRH